MTLLRELQSDALDPNVEITTVLRKARVLAARLKNAEFEAWIQHELNGYPDGELPDYRILSVNAKAYLIIGLTQIPAADVMASKIPERFRDWATKAYIFSPVTELASLIEGIDSNRHDGLQSPWPQELAINYGGAGYGVGNQRVQCLKAWQEISAAKIVAIIETVRNRLLEFVLQIEAEAPAAGEAEPGHAPLPQDTVTQIFHTYISGGVAHIGSKESQGGSYALHVGSMQDSQIQQGVTGSLQTISFEPHSKEREDLEKLLRLLFEHMDEMHLDARARKTTEAQIATIRAQLHDDEPNAGIIAQAGRTLRSVTEGAIGSLMAAAAQPALWHWAVQFMQTHFR